VSLNTVTGLMLVFVPLAFNGAFFMLQRAFEYPDILRRPAAEVLRRFRQGGAPLRRLWYVLTLSAVLFTPIPVLLMQRFGSAAPWYLGVGTAVGVLAGVAQFLGLMRWPFLVPTLAELHEAPGASPAARESVVVVFQAFHRYLGVAVGEHLGYLFTGAWTILLSMALAQGGVVSPAYGWLGIVPALGILIGVLEETGFKAAGAINAIGYVLWSVWLIALGVALLTR
jgi:hypothetical protein